MSLIDEEEVDATGIITPPPLSQIRPPPGAPPPVIVRNSAPIVNRVLFNCKFCTSSLSSKDELALHEQEHIGKSKPYQCEYCEKCFSSKSQRERHHRTHTGEKPHKCKICQKRFAEKANLQVHQIVHTGRKPYKCHQCNQRYTQRGALRTHIRSHTGERPFKCQICGKGFKSAGVLKVHKRTHSDEKAFSCTFPGCGGRYKHKSTLVTHMRTHTGEKPYRCESCEKRFADKAALIVHRRRLHSNVRPYLCKLCDKRFSENSSLRRHQSVHTGARNFWCDVCEKGFATSGSRSSHYKTKLHQKNAEAKGVDWENPESPVSGQEDDGVLTTSADNVAENSEHMSSHKHMAPLMTRTSASPRHQNSPPNNVREVKRVKRDPNTAGAVMAGPSTQVASQMSVGDILPAPSKTRIRRTGSNPSSPTSTTPKFGRKTVSGFLGASSSNTRMSGSSSSTQTSSVLGYDDQNYQIIPGNVDTYPSDDDDDQNGDSTPPPALEANHTPAKILRRKASTHQPAEQQQSFASSVAHLQKHMVASAVVSKAVTRTSDPGSSGALNPIHALGISGEAKNSTAKIRATKFSGKDGFQGVQQGEVSALDDSRSNTMSNNVDEIDREMCVSDVQFTGSEMTFVTGMTNMSLQSDLGSTSNTSESDTFHSMTSPISAPQTIMTY